MSDSFEFTLHSPLTKEDWNKLSDDELENTISITFQTPQGRQVKYIKCDVFDKIRADIDAIETHGQIDEHTLFVRGAEEVKKMALNIIDKYRNEVSP